MNVKIEEKKTATTKYYDSFVSRELQFNKPSCFLNTKELFLCI